MAKKKILAVEDEPDLLMLLQRKLTDSGFEAIGVPTGGQALEAIRKSKPDLILLDILLPDIDGITILTELVKTEATRKIPVIILSNLADEGSFEQAKAIGDYEYLIKAKTPLDEVVSHINKKLGI